MKYEFVLISVQKAVINGQAQYFDDHHQVGMSPGEHPYFKSASHEEIPETNFDALFEQYLDAVTFGIRQHSYIYTGIKPFTSLNENVRNLLNTIYIKSYPLIHEVL